MPLFLIVIGGIILSAVINDKLGQLGTLASGDLFGQTGKPGFIVWAGAILVIGAIFRAIDLPDAGKALVFLVIVAYLLGNANIPQQILAALEQAGGAPAAAKPTLYQSLGVSAPAAPAAPASPAGPAAPQ